MGEYYELRISRYRDSRCFEQIVELLLKLFPDRTRDEFASALAVTPVYLTHKATQLAVSELEEALVELGASVAARRVASGTDTKFGTIEVADDFIVNRRQKRDAPSTEVPSPTSSSAAVVRPPWEED